MANNKTAREYSEQIKAGVKKKADQNKRQSTILFFIILFLAQEPSPRTCPVDAPPHTTGRTGSDNPQQDADAEPDKQNAGKIFKTPLDFRIVPECIRNSRCTDGDDQAPYRAGAEKDGPEKEK